MLFLSNPVEKMEIILKDMDCLCYFYIYKYVLFYVYNWYLNLNIDIAVSHWNRSMRREFSFTALLLRGFVSVLKWHVNGERFYFPLCFDENISWSLDFFFPSFRRPLYIFCKVTVSEVEKVTYISHKRPPRW